MGCLRCCQLQTGLLPISSAAMEFQSAVLLMVMGVRRYVPAVSRGSHGKQHDVRQSSHDYLL